MSNAGQKAVLIVALFLSSFASTQAQSTSGSTQFCEEPARRTKTVDTRGLGVFYCATNPVLTRSLQGAHLSARPIFYGAVPLAWGAAYIQGGDDYSDAYRLALSQGATFGLVLGIKHAVGRPRPFVHRALNSRSAHYSRTEGEKYVSFPSGHAAVSAALATSWGLSHPEWYVVGSGAVWTLGVSLSRLYLGVHYPSDVLVGTVLGVGMAALVHHFRGALTPDRFQKGIHSGAQPTPIKLRIRF